MFCFFNPTVRNKIKLPYCVMLLCLPFVNPSLLKSEDALQSCRGHPQCKKDSGSFCRSHKTKEQIKNNIKETFGVLITAKGKVVLM